MKMPTKKPILVVDKNDTEKTIREKYLAAAKKHHPDANNPILNHPKTTKKIDYLQKIVSLLSRR
jgi:DnaJ-class molecular chaperone